MDIDDLAAACEAGSGSARCTSPMAMADALGGVAVEGGLTSRMLADDVMAGVLVTGWLTKRRRRPRPAREEVR